LKSPSKQNRIPASPFHPSIQDFWSPTAVNEWVDQFSPEKPVLTIPKLRLESPSKSKSSTDTSTPSSTSPRKSPTKAERQIKRSFQEQRQQLATDFLEQLDQTITEGKIAELSLTTGGIKIEWSKKLNSTAGRANWKRQVTTKKHSDGTIDNEQKHYASIELAEKVIDDEHRLINTLAHEFCHLATFMISEVKNNPHGKEFKQW
jgi:hypothetical protein